MSDKDNFTSESDRLHISSVSGGGGGGGSGTKLQTYMIFCPNFLDFGGTIDHHPFAAKKYPKTF